MTVLSVACALALPDCLNEAANRFNAWLRNPSNRPPTELRDVVYTYGMQHTNSEANWQQLLELYKSESDASEKVKLMSGLTAVKDVQLIQRLIDLASTESLVRSQDYMTFAKLIVMNPVGESIYWNYYRKHWPELVARLTLNNMSLSHLIVTVTSKFATEDRLREVQEFYNKYPEAGAGAKPRKAAIENIRQNINWLKENRADISNWITTVYKPQ